MKASKPLTFFLLGLTLSTFSCSQGSKFPRGLKEEIEKDIIRGLASKKQADYILEKSFSVITNEGIQYSYFFKTGKYDKKDQTINAVLYAQKNGINYWFTAKIDGTIPKLVSLSGDSIN